MWAVYGECVRLVVAAGEGVGDRWGHIHGKKTT
jgi:hypothetical protein